MPTYLMVQFSGKKGAWVVHVALAAQPYIRRRDGVAGREILQTNAFCIANAVRNGGTRGLSPLWQLLLDRREAHPGPNLFIGVRRNLCIP